MTTIYLLSGTFLMWLSLAFTGLTAVLFFRKATPCKIAGTVLLGFLVGVLWMWGYDALFLQPARQYDGQSVTTTIEISDYSFSTTYGSAADGKVKLSGRDYRVRVYMDDFYDLQPGDCVQGTFTFGMTIPKGMEESEYFQGKGIFLLADAEKEVAVTATQGIPAKYFASKIRKQIHAQIDGVFPQDTRGFARALLLGDSSLLTYEEDTAFKVSGIRHVIAVSGLHVSILFSLAYAVAGHRRVYTAVIGIPVLILFAAVAGFTPSITRACIMQILMIFALLLKRDYDPPTALAFAVLVMLAGNPMTITSVSFQLSVGCMVGIFLFSSRVQQYLFRKLGSPTGKTLRARLARWISSGTAITLSAMTVTTPLVAWYFGMVSLVSVFTNLLTLWAISFIFGGIILACVCGALWLPAGQGIAWLISWLIRYVITVAKAFSSSPMAAVYTRSIYIVLWIGVCYLLFGVFLLSQKKRPVLLLAYATLCLCIAVAASWIVPRLDDFRVTVFDVGEGQTILLQNRGKNYLVDCGGASGDKAADIAAETLLSQGIFTLDGVVLTHYDADHTAGVIGLLSRVKTKALYLPDIPDGGSVKAQLTHAFGDKVQWIEENTVIDAMTLITARVDDVDENENSLCVLFQPEDCDILITGDRGKAGEKALTESVDLPQIELLVAGHHGSGNSTNLELLKATMPDAVVISTGARHGHPAKDVLYRLELFGCTVWRTDLDGTMIFRG